MRAATAKYHDVQNALNDGFIPALGCGAEPEGSGMGALYVKPDHVRDGKIDPALPDVLIYDNGPNGPRLVAVELIMPYALWPNADPPTFFGTTFMREDEVHAFALHVWVWLNNPNGMFAESNPRVTC